ncbi:hypothetical protein ACA910_005345 [Epithemia clementina (nom. ined.)]
MIKSSQQPLVRSMVHAALSTSTPSEPTSRKKNNRRRRTKESAEVATKDNAAATAAATNDDDRKEQKKERIYQELKLLAAEIRYHDNLYYNNLKNNNMIMHNNNGGNVSTSTTTTEKQPFEPGNQAATTGAPRLLTDAEYDALVTREEQLCRAYPDLLQRLERETRLGNVATRFGGRVGSVLVPSSPDEANDTRTTNEAVAAVATKEATTLDRFALKRKHGRRMLSLENVVSRPELGSWLDRAAKAAAAVHRNNNTGNTNQTQSTTTTTATATSNTTPRLAGTNHNDHTITITTEPKIDGLSLSLRYVRSNEKDDKNNNNADGHNNDDKNSDWALQWAATRGDGELGQDVTSTIRDIGPSLGIPLQLQSTRLLVTKNALPKRQAQQGKHDDEDNCNSIIEIRGEVVFPTSVFESNEALQNFSNPRNAASGILLRKEENDESRQMQSYLKFYAYDMVLLRKSPSTTQRAEKKKKKSVTKPDLVVLMDQLSGGEIRQRLQDLGFSLPQPSVTTTLTLPPPAEGMEKWSNVWNDTDIANMLVYHEQLNLHRRRQDPADITSKPKKSSKAWKNVVWGDYEMDGCVHKVDNPRIRSQMGDSTRAPRWAVAHKFPAKAVVTRLLGINVQVGRTGVLTPVAVLEPVELDGVTIQSATLHNFRKMRQILLGSSDVVDDEDEEEHSTQQRIPVGVSVLVRRSGDVIPQVVQRVGSSLLSNGLEDGGAWMANSTGEETTISLATPTTCPSCGSPVEETVKNSNKTAGQIARCCGPVLFCEPRALANLEFAFSRDALNVKGLSEGRLRQLKEHGLVQVPSDLFLLTRNETEFMETVSEFHGWGEKSARNLARAANQVASEGVSLSRFIYSLGIPYVGKGASDLVAGVYKSTSAFLSDMKRVASLEHPDMESFSVLREKTESTKGIGPVVLDSLTNFSQESPVVDAVFKLRDSVRITDDEEGVMTVDQASKEILVDGPLAGMNVVFTGSLPNITRTEAYEMAIRMGAKKTSDKVTKLTDLVVAGQKSGSKLADAAARNIRTMEADEFIHLASSHNVNVPLNGPLLVASKQTITTEVRQVDTSPAKKEKEASQVDTSPVKGGPLQGMRVVFTGSLPQMNRKEAKDIAMQMGAMKTTDRVSKLTDLVVSGIKSPKTVVDEAKQLGITVLTADEFLAMVKGFKRT